MIHHMVKISKGNQGGFTLIGLVIALAITGLISLGTATSIVHLMKGTTYNRNHLTAIEQLQNVGYWISTDARMAQHVVLGEVLGFPLTLSWGEYGSTTNHIVVYAINSDSLERKEYISSGNIVVPPVITVVAQNVDLSATNCELNDKTLTLNVTSKVGTGSAEESETRKYEVVCKPLQQ